MVRSLLVGLCCSLVSTSLVMAAGPEPVLLWPHGAPGAKGNQAPDQPQLRLYPPAADQATGAGVVICPGGAYGVLATDHEGHQVAKWFNSIGVAGFVVKYRLGPRYHHPAPLQDVQRAIRYVRANASRWGLDSRRIGVMGFSAGGHLASTAATHFDGGDPTAEDHVEQADCRPDFAILGYPVISLVSPQTHHGSRRNLLGDSPAPGLAASLSNDLQVTRQTPPAFLFHTGEDSAVAVQHSLSFYSACVAADVPAELHVYQNGPHGVGLASGDPVASSWTIRLHDWMRASGFLHHVQRAPVAGKIQVNGQPLRWGMITFLPSHENAPSAFAMVSRGEFAIPASRGAVVGTCRVEVRNLGAVEPHPTIESVQRVDPGNLFREIRAGMNSIDLEFASPE